MKVYCPYCKKEVEYKIEKRDLKEFRGIKVNTFENVAICNECNQDLYINEIEDENNERIYKIYREKANIIKAEDIVRLREKYDISQRELTSILGFGKMTINRYERGGVPTKSQSDYIKLLIEKERLTNMEVGESQQLTVTINPYNATDQNVVWKSSDESIAIVSSTGVVNAIKSGLVDITVTSANGKSDVIKISINEVQKNENNAIINTTSVYKNNQVNNSISNSTEESNPLGELIILGLLCGGGYLSYKNSKKR